MSDTNQLRLFNAGEIIEAKNGTYLIGNNIDNLYTFSQQDLTFIMKIRIMKDSIIVIEDDELFVNCFKVIDLYDKNCTDMNLSKDRDRYRRYHVGNIYGMTSHYIINYRVFFSLHTARDYIDSINKN